jgi:hypothetical protein
VASKVGHCSFAYELRSEYFEEAIDAGAKFAREFVDVGFPVFFWSEKLFRAPIVVETGEEHLCLDVFLESVRSIFELFGAGSM